MTISNQQSGCSAPVRKFDLSHPVLPHQENSIHFFDLLADLPLDHPTLPGGWGEDQNYEVHESLDQR
jgi:hypothetical protein